MITFFKIFYQERKRKAQPARALLMKCYLQLPKEASHTRASRILISITTLPLRADIRCVLATGHCSRRRDGEKLESHEHHSYISLGSNGTRSLIYYCPKNQRTWLSTALEIKPPGCSTLHPCPLTKCDGIRVVSLSPCAVQNYLRATPLPFGATGACPLVGWCPYVLSHLCLHQSWNTPFIFSSEISVTALKNKYATRVTGTTLSGSPLFIPRPHQLCSKRKPKGEINLIYTSSHPKSPIMLLS